MMGIALGGLGVISLRLPFSLSSNILNLVDLPTILLASFLVAIFTLIAYFTNPSEASFRAFLTELAFRQHLSRLSEAQDAEPDEDYDDNSLRNSILDYKGPRKKGVPGHPSSTPAHDTPIVFHFANKASVSLRTPGYHFRSFAVLSFAIISPVEMALATAQPTPKPVSWANPANHGAWFIGAFGKWWLGLEMNMHPRQVRLAAHDDDDLRERESARALADDADSNNNRTRHVEDGSPPHKAYKPSLPRRASSAALPRTKAALRERLSLQTVNSHKREPHAPPRPTTPPPLPKSASLPLHAKRLPPPSPDTRKAKNERTASNHHNVPLLPTTATPELARTRTPSSHDLSPVIADILTQLDAARSATSDLHTQLSDFQGASARAHADLHAEVDAARATKKREDAGRAEVKTKTKFLDDARRQADGTKREAEKRLKAAATARDGAAGRIERLGREMEELQQRMVDDAERVVESRVQSEVERDEITEALAAKREEIKIAEDVVVALTARARDLEGKISDETERLQKMKEDAEARRRHAASYAQPIDTSSSWPPPLSLRGPHLAPHQLAPTLGTDTAHRASDFQRSPTSPRPHPLALGGLSNHTAIVLDNEYAPSSQFAPFGDSPTSPAYAGPGPLSPISTSLIPSSLMQSMESPRSALPTGETFFSHIAHAHGNGHAIRPSDGMHSPVDEPIAHTNRFDSQRAVLPPRPASPTAPQDDELSVASTKPRRWFSTSAKEKGLNPDAKVFTLPRGRPLLASGSASGASTPGSAPGFGSDVFLPRSADVSPPRLGVAGSFFSSLHNAFTPSPAEREALQRALGSGSGNASLERVSSHGSGGPGSVHSSPLVQHAAHHHAHSTSEVRQAWGGVAEGDTLKVVNASAPPHRSAFFNPWPAADGQA